MRVVVDTIWPGGTLRGLDASIFYKDEIARLDIGIGLLLRRPAYSKSNRRRRLKSSATINSRRLGISAPSCLVAA